MKTFLKDWFSSKNSVSSKRIAGTIGFFTGIYLVLTGHQGHEVSTLLAVSSGLLLGGTIDRFSNQNNPML